MTSTIAQIWNGAVKLWNEAEAAIDSDVAKVQAALPASAQPAFSATVSALKQDASDALAAADGALNAVLPGIVIEGEKLLDTAMATYSGGLALPLVPATNQAITDIANATIAAVNSWVLKQQAALAANTAPAAK